MPSCTCRNLAFYVVILAWKWCFLTIIRFWSTFGPQNPPQTFGNPSAHKNWWHRTPRDTNIDNLVRFWHSESISTTTLNQGHGEKKRIFWLRLQIPPILCPTMLLVTCVKVFWSAGSFPHASRSFGQQRIGGIWRRSQIIHFSLHALDWMWSLRCMHSEC